MTNPNTTAAAERVTEPQYTIAPLVWKAKLNGTIVAKTPFGEAYIDEYRGRINLWTADFHSRQFKTLEAAQLAAEQWYRERLRPALKPVEVKDA